MKTVLLWVYHALKPFWDVRVLVLVGSCLTITAIMDFKGLIAFLTYCIFVSGFWGCSILIAKILRPATKDSELRRKALDDPLAASVVYSSHVLLRIAIAFSYILWWGWR